MVESVFTVPERNRDREMLYRNVILKIKWLLYVKSNWSYVIHVLECILKNVYTKFGGHRYCKIGFRAIILFSSKVELGKCNSGTTCTGMKTLTTLQEQF